MSENENENPNGDAPKSNVIPINHKLAQQAARRGKEGTVAQRPHPAPPPEPPSAAPALLRGQWGHTPLHYAARHNDGLMMQHLLAAAGEGAGALVQAQANGGLTALHYAAMEDSAQAASVLLSHGATVDALDDDGQTPLNWAVWNNAQTVCVLLLSAQCRVNLADKRGITPLHVAMWNNALAIIEMLLGAGADLTLLDNEQNPPIAYAPTDAAETLRRMVRQWTKGPMAP